MRFLTIDLIKRQLRIDSEFLDDDESLEFYGVIAENVVETEINRKIYADQLELDNASDLTGVVINEQLKGAMLMQVSDLYENRSVKTSEVLYKNMAYTTLVQSFRVYS